MYVIRLENKMGPDRYPVWAKYTDDDNNDIIWYHTTTRPEYPLINNILKFDSEEEAKEWWVVNNRNVANRMCNDEACDLDYDHPKIVYFDDDEEDFEDDDDYTFGITHERYAITTFYGKFLCIEQDLHHNGYYDSDADTLYYLINDIGSLNSASVFCSYDKAEEYYKDNADNILKCIGEECHSNLYITRLAINVFAYEPPDKLDI